MKKNKDIIVPKDENYKKGHHIISESIIQVDPNTGEYIQQIKSTKVESNKEPDFIKLYLNTMMSFQGIEGINVDLLLCLCNNLQGYNNGPEDYLVFRSDKITRANMAKELKVTDESIKKYIRLFKKSGILVSSEYKGVYYANPWLLARGDWKNIKELRANFDIIQNEWVVTVKGQKEKEEEA